MRFAVEGVSHSLFYAPAPSQNTHTTHTHTHTHAHTHTHLRSDGVAFAFGIQIPTETLHHLKFVRRVCERFLADVPHSPTCAEATESNESRVQGLV